MFSMLTNSFQRAQRQTQRVPSLEPRHRGRRTITRCFEKRNNLRAQRLDVDDVEMLHVNTGPRAACPWWFETADRRALRGVVNRDVIVRLEETHLPNLLSPDSRRRDIRHGSRRELEPRIRRVNFVGEDRDPDRMNVCDFDVLADEPLHDIQIVNHQVEHNIDVERARGELPDAMYLEVNRLADVWLQSDHRGIEALEVSDL